MRVLSNAALAVLCGFALETAIGVAQAQSVGQPAAQSASAPTAAAMAAKRPLTHNDFDSWKSIANTTLSRDGKWLAYAIQPQDGDGELVVREIATGKERREPVGALPPPATMPDPENPDAPPPPRTIRVVFTSDARFLIATTYPTKAEMQAARKARKRAEDMPKGGLIIVDLAAADKPAVPVANVKSIHVPAKGGAWLAYLKEATAEPATPAINTAPATTAAAKPDAADFTYADDSLDQAAARRPAAGATATTNNAAPAVTYGTELVLRELTTGREQSFANVTEVSFARDGKALLFAVSAKADAENGVYAITPTSGADAQATALPQVTALLKGKGKYSKLAWDREQTQLAFFSDRDDAAAKQPQVKVYHWVRGAGGSNTSASEVVINKDTGMRDGLPPSDRGTLAFSWDGKKLYVPTAPRAKPPRAADAVPEEERVVADLWRWNDDYVQPIQRVRATQERNRTYRAVFDIASKRLTPIADEAMRTVLMSDDGTRAIGLDDRAYRRLTDFDGGYNDVYLIDTRTAKSLLVQKKLRNLGGGGGGPGSAFQWSPDGKWVLFYREQHWHVVNTADGKTRNLSAGVSTKTKRAFFNEEQDTPGPKGPYGTAGWLSDSSSALVYDRFDVWQVFADGRAPQNLTNDAGRKDNVRLRVQPLEPVDEDDDERGINPSKPLVLRSESEVNRASGFYRTTFAAGATLERLIWGDANHRVVARARDAERVVITASRFDRYPDLLLTNTNFAAPRVVTKVGAQVEPFLWGSAELMSFTSAAGKPLSAAVYKPANFDPKKKYPLMVYIYEKLSQNVHNFVDPRPSNGINASLYTSNGYVVLMPDIVYAAKGWGKPGQDAMDAVMPAIDKIIKQGFINEKAIGIQGHSWGGYQIAWMVTRTNRFRAAEAGAPVGNMTSAYSGIRWGSGLPRQFQYEQGQSRIAKSMAEDPKSYIEASPVFAAHKVTTPLLILHNDADDAVPWYQGIELFLALRRHNKEAYLFNYNNQLHNLRRRADQKDFALRMHQFFDHYLKGAAAPEWMTKGINFLDRDEEKDAFRKSREGAK
jgi:dipeptidyl aminopeptidase/acylaminoacyl peptidase